MKKLLSFVIMAGLVIALCGCGSDYEESTYTDVKSDTETVDYEPEEESTYSTVVDSDTVSTGKRTTFTLDEFITAYNQIVENTVTNELEAPLVSIYDNGLQYHEVSATALPSYTYTFNQQEIKSTFAFFMDGDYIQEVRLAIPTDQFVWAMEQNHTIAVDSAIKIATRSFLLLKDGSATMFDSEKENVLNLLVETLDDMDEAQKNGVYNGPYAKYDKGYIVGSWSSGGGDVLPMIMLSYGAGDRASYKSFSNAEWAGAAPIGY